MLKDIGPFQVRPMDALQYIQGYLSELNFEKAKKVAYDTQNLYEIKGWKIKTMHMNVHLDPSGRE